MIGIRRGALLIALGLGGVVACDDGSGGGLVHPDFGGLPGDDAGADGAPADAEVGDDGGGPACIDDSDCPDADFCQKAGGDLTGACTPGCRAHPDNCDPGTCDADTHACVPTCHTDADCPDGQGCRAGMCDAGACRVDDPTTCGDEQSCDADSRTCVDAAATACCLADGCALKTAAACAAEGGEARDAASCDPDPCVAPCHRDTDCADGSWCDVDSGRCNAGCRQKPDDCGSERYCDPAHACVEARCASDDDCARLDGDFYCQTEVGACRRACEGDGECPQGFACEDGRCARHMCADDEAEPDDDAGSAHAVAFDEGGVAERQAGRICPLNADWYAVTLAHAGDRVRAELGCDGDADLGLELVDANGHRVAGANDPGCREALVWPSGGDPGAAGTFYVKVMGAAPADGVGYELSLFQLPPVDACAADGSEEDDVPASATALLGDGDDADVAGRTACPGDDDWFRMDLGAGDGLTLDLTTHGNAGHHDERLTFDLVGPGAPALPFDGSDPRVLHPDESLAGPDGGEILRLTLPPGNAVIAEGTWYLRVRGEDPTQSAAYDLQVTASRNGATCRPDAEEANDDAAHATDLMARDLFAVGGLLRPEVVLTLSDLSRCLGDEDWFHVTLADGDRLTTRVALHDEAGQPARASGGALTLGVVDAQGVVVGVEASDFGPELNTRTPPVVAGDYYVRVAGARGARALAYDLSLVRSPGGAGCSDDAYDTISRNDDRADATPLDVAADDPAQVSGADLCNAHAGPDGDVDWYTFQIADAGRVTVDLRFVNADGDLDVTVWREGGARPVATGDGFEDNEHVEFDAQPGRYYVEVSSLAGDENDYDLEIALAAAPMCDPDALEANGDQDHATPVGPGFDRQGLWICERPADEDWFVLHQAANTTMTVHADFLRDDDGWITFDVYDADGAYVQSVEEPLDGQCLVLDARPAATTWYFAVSARTFDPADDTPDRVAYDLQVANGDQCADLEPLYVDVDWPHL